MLMKPWGTTAWKVSKYRVISGSNTGKYVPELTPYLDTFHAVNPYLNKNVGFLSYVRSILYNYLAHFSSQDEKLKKIPSRKKFLMFQEMELSGSNIKEFIIFYQKKVFLIFPEKHCTFKAKLEKWKNPPPENVLYFRKRKPQKNFLYFLKRKLFLYFGTRKTRNNYLYFRKWYFLIFQEELPKPQASWINFSKNTLG